MRLSFAMLFSALAVCLLGVAMSAPIIVTDLTSGNAYTLPLGYPGTLYDAQYDTIYHTFQRFTNNPTVLQAGSVAMPTQFVVVNITWAGDVSDTYNFAIPAGLSVLPVAGSSAQCHNSTQTTLSSTTQSCLYNLSWSTPFTGTFSIVYVNSSFPVGSETIDLTFVFAASSSSSTAPFIRGDPQFVGLRGQSYQVHGIDGAVYNLITESNTQVNSRFVFLTEGECPAASSSGCWSHPGSYMGDMSFQAVVDGKLHAALITAGSAKKGFSNVQMDGKALAVGDKVSFGSFSVSYTSTHGVSVSLENYSLELSNSDMFLNMALSAKVALNQLTSHGLIGQTHANKVYKSAVRYIEGEVDDYLIADNDVFGTDFPFNRFNQ